MENLKDYLKKEEGYEYLLEVPNRGLCGIKRFLFTYGLVYGLDATGYNGRYCYPNFEESILALATWSGEGNPPDNKWIKHKGRDVDECNPLAKNEYEVY